MGLRFALTPLARWWTKVIGLALGYGLIDNISDAYVFLMNEFEPGDQVFLFGFSRAAYTARALAAFLQMFGLIRRGDEGLVPYPLRRFKGNVRNAESFEIAHRFKATFSSECKPHFLGVWDTVSSVGWLYDPLTPPLTAHNPDITIGHHAMSIDERRCAFRQNLWQFRPGLEPSLVCGCSCDVGGGYEEAESGLSKIALQWMLRDAKTAGLPVDAQGESEVHGGTPPFVNPDPCAVIHNSLTLAWLPLEFFPRRVTDMTVTPPRKRWTMPLRPRRHVLTPAESYERRRAQLGYSPPNLPQIVTVEP
jgi:uncharacterized protein (DUF2235 family)